MTPFEAGLIEAMSLHLTMVSSRLAFVESRVSAESLVRDECALAATEFLSSSSDDAYHVHMEKKVGGKKIDLLIVPVSDGREDLSRAYLFELKMAWPGGLHECAAGVRHDIDVLRGRSRAWSLVLFFAFDVAPQWVPFGKRGIGFEDGLVRFIELVRNGPPSATGPIFPMAYRDVSGRAQLLAWELASIVEDERHNSRLKQPAGAGG